MPFTETYSTSTGYLAHGRRMDWRSESSPDGNADTQGHGPDVPDNIRVETGALVVESGVQNYGDSFFEFNFPWTGTVLEFDLYSEVTNSATGGYPHMVFSDSPGAVTGFDEENAWGPLPDNGYDLALRTPYGRKFVDHVQTDYWPGGSPGPRTGDVLENVWQHWRIERTTTTVSIYCEDNLELSFPFADPTLMPLYVKFGTHNHASVKYTTDPFPGPLMETLISRWDNWDFDEIGAEYTFGEVPPTTTGTYFGYPFTATEGTAPTLTTAAVDTTGAIGALVVLNVGLFAPGLVDSASRLHVRVNGGTDVAVPWDLVQTHVGSYNFVVEVPLAELIDGVNTLKVWGTGVSNFTDATIANVAVLALMPIGVEAPGVYAAFQAVKRFAAGATELSRLVLNGVNLWIAINPPGAPTALAATAGSSGTVDLTWTAPASDGGATITDYRVQYRTTAGPGSWTTFTDAVSTATTASVTGLTNDTSYDFQVAAINSEGVGTYSAPDSATPTAPVGGNPWLYDFSDYADGDLETVEPTLDFKSGVECSVVSGYAQCNVDWFFGRYDRTTLVPGTTMYAAVEVEWLTSSGGDIVLMFFCDSTDGSDGSRNAVVFRQDGTTSIEHEFGGSNAPDSHTGTAAGVHTFALIADTTTDTYTLFHNGVQYSTFSYSDWRQGSSNEKVGFLIGTNNLRRMHKLHWSSTELPG